MWVIQVAEFGGPEVLTPVEVPDPVPGPGEAVVDVAAADVLFVDTQVRLGAFDFGVQLPYVPGDGYSGTVSAVGDGVDPGWVGRRVAAYTGGFLGTGGYRERGLARADELVPVPDGVSSEVAAALLHDAITGLTLTDALDVRPGEWVLITAAAGGMGVLLLQLAAAAGGRVVGAARGEEKLALVRQNGAEPVDYSSPEWADAARALTGGAGFAAVLDGAGGAVGETAFTLTADGGRFSGHGAASGVFAGVDPGVAAARGVSVCGIAEVQLTQERMRVQLARALAEAAAGRLVPAIGATFPLEKASDAHEALAARAVPGKALLLP
ncbi:zinc-binding dehydrogenase [Cryptosporangium aurantiacum]|uniref:NADPH2:quinone reductase n=1 Tax=Cryptosporangium aurantiacum TaxID=134849 RepID=A0A1M7RME4_9ACTN|nr:zinc-binding dehydrogenase [Cryptosporangium aurantiacum]SHN47272.1 NADPH2:quinone reductase [Cryptosporangium aurantiacum]